VTDVTLEDLGTQMERLLGEFAGMRREFAEIRAAQADLSNGQTVLAETMFQIERDIVQIKDVLARKPEALGE
jgi:hypothetical protein